SLPGYLLLLEQRRQQRRRSRGWIGNYLCHEPFDRRAVPIRMEVCPAEYEVIAAVRVLKILRSAIRVHECALLRHIDRPNVKRLMDVSDEMSNQKQGLSLCEMPWIWRRAAVSQEFDAVPEDMHDVIRAGSDRFFKVLRLLDRDVGVMECVMEGIIGIGVK